MTEDQTATVTTLAQKFEGARIDFEELAATPVPTERAARIERAVKLYVLEAEAIVADEALAVFKKLLRSPT